MKNGNILKINFLIAFIFVLIGCSSIKPITQGIINDVGGNSEIEKFQYYVSTNLTLKNVQQTRDQQNITRGGTATITDVIYTNRIIILKTTMGVALKSFRDDNDILVLEVCFEENDNKRITFRQDGPGSDRKFFIVYNDPFTRRIDYGGELYTVDFSGDRPYLRIKMNKQLKQRIKTKWAAGRRVQN